MIVQQWPQYRDSIMDTSEKSAIKGKHIAITGSLLFYKRQEAFELIRGIGGIPQENVTKETDYLVVGHYRKNTIINGKSNKRILAERYMSQGCGIKIIKEDQFLPMLWYSLTETTGK
jgi:DNA polymerase-3 subunit epsilon